MKWSANGFMEDGVMKTTVPKRVTPSSFETLEPEG